MASEPKPKPPTPWLKRALIPLWILQLLLMIFILFIASAYIAVDSKEAFAPDIVFVLIISVICTILDVTEIILFARRKLQRFTYLTLQCVKVGLFLIWFIVKLANGLSKEDWANNTTETDITEQLISAGALLLAFVGSLIYASVIFHRKRIARRRTEKAIPPIIQPIQDRYNAAPMTENGTLSPDYARLAAVNGLRSDGSTVVYTSQPPMVHTVLPGLKESDSGALGPFESHGMPIRRQELGSEVAEEMPVGEERYELGSSNSVRDAKDASFRLDLVRDLPAENTTAC